MVTGDTFSKRSRRVPGHRKLSFMAAETRIIQSAVEINHLVLQQVRFDARSHPCLGENGELWLDLRRQEGPSPAGLIVNIRIIHQVGVRHWPIGASLVLPLVVIPLQIVEGVVERVRGMGLLSLFGVGGISANEPPLLLLDLGVVVVHI
mmetsp:Transcript_15964/g.24734  ORF Transcript_15964/g.24734 Transcript_15964/m.24734 type:complete len:149 (+) Transcript_15964:3487-3933(+)